MSLIVTCSETVGGAGAKQQHDPFVSQFFPSVSSLDIFFCVAVGSERCIQIAAAYFFTLHTYGRIWIAANFLNLCGIRRVFRNSESDVTRFDFHRKPESHTYVCAHVQREAAVVEWSSKRCIISTATWPGPTNNDILTSSWPLRMVVVLLCYPAVVSVQT
jgi:hypothetical protein